MLSHLPDQGDLSLQKVDEITIEENQNLSSLTQGTNENTVG